MEGAPLSPEGPEDDESKASKHETEDTDDNEDSKEKRLSVFEKLFKGDEGEEAESEAPKKLFEFLGVDKKEDTEPEPASEPSPEATEADTTDLENLAEDERQQVAQQYVEARAVEVDQELTTTPEDTIEEEVIQANATLLANIKQKLVGGEQANDEMLDEALDETLQQLAIEDAPTEETVVEDEPALTEPVEFVPAELYEEIADVPDLPPVPPTSPPPPVPPAPPAPGLPPAPGIPFEPFAAIEQAPASPAPEPEIVTVPRRRREAANLLVGGIVGYMIGRRRGRLKTEAALLPVQEKLTKQVKDLQEQIGLREEKIRKLTYERAAQKLEQPLVTMSQEADNLERSRPLKPMERVGDLMAHERLAQYKTLERPNSPDTMMLSELLAVARTIEIESSSAKKMYEAGRLDERGLREIVRAHLRGEQLEAVLHERLKPVVLVGSPEALRTNTTQPTDFPTTSSIANIVEQSIHQNTASAQPQSYELPTDYQPVAKKPSSIRTAAEPMKIPIIVGVTCGLLVALYILL